MLSHLFVNVREWSVPLLLGIDTEEHEKRPIAEDSGHAGKAKEPGTFPWHLLLLMLLPRGLCMGKKKVYEDPTVGWDTHGKSCTRGWKRASIYGAVGNSKFASLVLIFIRSSKVR